MRIVGSELARAHHAALRPSASPLLPAGGHAGVHPRGALPRLPGHHCGCADIVSDALRSFPGRRPGHRGGAMVDHRAVRRRIRTRADLDRRPAGVFAGSLAVARPSNRRRAAGHRPAKRVQSSAVLDASAARAPGPHRHLQHARQRDDRATRGAPGGGEPGPSAHPGDAAGPRTVRGRHLVRFLEQASDLGRVVVSHPAPGPRRSRADRKRGRHHGGVAARPSDGPPAFPMSRPSARTAVSSSGFPS